MAAGPGLTPAEENALRQRVGNILMSKPCQRINISVDRVNVNGSGFSYVALAVLNTIKFAVGELPANSEAQYSIGFNTFRFPHAGYGVGGANAAFERQTIVHEATHAVIDATSSNRSVLKMTHEMAGLMAGALYNAFSADFSSRRSFLRGRRAAPSIPPHTIWRSRSPPA